MFVTYRSKLFTLNSMIRTRNLDFHPPSAQSAQSALSALECSPGQAEGRAASPYILAPLGRAALPVAAPSVPAITLCTLCNLPPLTLITLQGNHSITAGQSGQSGQ